MEDKVNFTYRAGERYASLSAKRFEDESYDEYKERMRDTKKMLKGYMKGRRIA